MSANYSFHTVLAKKLRVTGMVEFIVGHRAIVSKTPEFQNNAFNSYETGAFIEVKFRVSGEKRYVVGSRDLSATEIGKAPDMVGKVREWVKQNAHTLVRERESFLKSTTKYTPVSGDKEGYIVINGRNHTYSSRQFRMKVVPVDTEGGIEIRSDDGSFSFLPDGYNSAVTSSDEVVTKEKPMVFADTRLSLSSLGAVSQRNGMFVKRGDWALLEAAKAIAEDGASNILMVGPSGSGKTSMPEAFASEYGMNYFKMDCATVRDPEEWFGHREAVEGTTVFVRSPFVKAVEAGNTLIILDEFNRVEPWLHNSLYALLDHTRKTQIHGENVTVAKGTIFVATANIGTSFTGTFVLDSALTNRFDATIFTTFLDKKSERKLLNERTGLDETSSEVVVDIMNKLRDMVNGGLELPVDISTRTSLKIALLITKSALPLKKILDYVILSLIDDTSTSKTVMDAISPLCSPTI